MQVDSLVSHLWGLVTQTQMRASLNHCQVKKAEPVI